MDGDGGDDGGMDRFELGALIGDYVPGMERPNGEIVDSESSVLESMGYVDAEAGTDRTGSDSTDSRTETLKTVLITVMVLSFGLGLLYFLLTGILAILGVQL
ncbi:hypothetical protein [Haloarchaeobius sp. TZWSO28]|uniref:hypothetical protein n=1 Tax=Haloarchaeobius sp. TZWSO28 TaxID=3446119 RepID=UPI003EB9F2BE